MSVTTDDVWSVETALLLGDKLENLVKIVPWIEPFQSGDYRTIVESDLCRTVFSSPGDEGDALERLSSCLAKYVESHSSVTDQIEILLLGIASLQAFIQSNWTGPKYVTTEGSPCVNDFLVQFLPEEGLKKGVSEGIRLALAVDGEEIATPIVHPELLLFAQVFFRAAAPDLKTKCWWLMRSLYIHQQILDEHSPTLKDELISLSARIRAEKWPSEAHLRALFHLEVARIHLHYGKVTVSEVEIKEALSILNMEVNMTGALGKRTQYQRRDLAQMMIDVKVNRRGDLTLEVPDQQFPTDVLLTDDVRLPHVVFTNARDGEFPVLQPIEQAALLAVFVQKKKSQAKDNLQNEELMPIINCVLSKPTVWALQLSALLFRSRMECDHKRTIERALRQTHELSVIFDTNPTPLPLRLNLFYCSYAPPSFIIASEYASILVTIGSMQSALEIYLSLQMWDEVIACYNFLKLRHKAAEVIQEQMKKGETVKLWCSLGDATDDVTCYEKAWELSHHRSAQAQRHWGMFFFHRKKYKESIPHLIKSLSINSLQVSLWFRLGYAALMEHEWEQSATAYRRYCALEPDSFEGWNNLAKAYILLEQNQRAYNALQEAIKCNYDMWQVWDNLMAVSCDCVDFEQVIHCYHRIMDLKDKHIDEQILTVLVSVITKDIPDCKGRPCSVHRKKALELFGRITSKVMNRPIIWLLYGDLTSSIEDQTPITRSKAVQYYQKAYTAALQDENWFRDTKSMQEVLNICDSLAKAHFAFVKVSPSTNESIHSLSSAKLSLQNMIARINRRLSEFTPDAVDEKFNKELASLNATLDTIQSDLLLLKNSS